MATLLLAEHDNKSLKDATNKALTAAKALGGDVHVLVAGKDARGVADAAAKLEGVSKVLVADGASYEHMLGGAAGGADRRAWCPLTTRRVAATTTGKNVLPRVAWRCSM
jgi:electron transfer flavoprotein alpha subunit